MGKKYKYSVFLFFGCCVRLLHSLQVDSNLQLCSRDGKRVLVNQRLWEKAFIGDIYLSACGVDKCDLRSIDKLLHKTESVEHRPINYRKLLNRYLIKPAKTQQLFDLLTIKLLMKNRRSALHVLAQAYAWQQRDAHDCLPDRPHEFIALCEAMKKRYPYIGDSLAMYAYFSYGFSERIVLNSGIFSYFSEQSVHRFLNQLPDDFRVVQFKDCDDFSSHFSHILDQTPWFRYKFATEGGHYLPFERCYVQNVKMPHKIKSSTIVSAIETNDLARIDRLIAANADFASLKSDFLLLKLAAFFCRGKMFEQLLQAGLDPFFVDPVTGEPVVVTLLDIGAHSLQARSEGVVRETLEQEPFDRICGCMLACICQKNPERLREILQHDSLSMYVQFVFPDIIKYFPKPEEPQLVPVVDTGCTCGLNRRGHKESRICEIM